MKNGPLLFDGVVMICCSVLILKKDESEKIAVFNKVTVNQKEQWWKKYSDLLLQ